MKLERQERASKLFVSCYFRSDKAYICFLPAVTPFWTSLLPSRETPDCCCFLKHCSLQWLGERKKGGGGGLFLCRVPTQPPQLYVLLVQSLSVQPQSHPTSSTQKGLPWYSASYSRGTSLVKVLLKDHSWSCSTSPAWRLALNCSHFCCN